WASPVPIPAIFHCKKTFPAKGKLNTKVSILAGSWLAWPYIQISGCVCSPGERIRLIWSARMLRRHGTIFVSAIRFGRHVQLLAVLSKRVRRNWSC
ncbi:hypothetical protein T265_01352, partial [Opisthorchis viverrini]